MTTIDPERVTGALVLDRPGVLVTLRGVADLTGMNLTTCQKRHARGQLLPPLGKVGRDYVWWAEDVVRWDTSGRPHRDEWERRAVLPRHP